jgi:hypothetical protein
MLRLPAPDATFLSISDHFFPNYAENMLQLLACLAMGPFALELCLSARPMWHWNHEGIDSVSGAGAVIFGVARK